jgi:SPP1 gp7 family putative phage head morphogenesis protein
MLTNAKDIPILSEKTMLDPRLAIERKFAAILTREAIVSVSAADFKVLKRILKNSIAKNIWGLWLAGVELGNAHGDRELDLIRHPRMARFSLENLPARRAIEDRVNLLAGNVSDTEFDRIRENLQQNVRGETSRADLVAAISEVLGGKRFRSRSLTIARTELTAAYNTGRVQSYRDNNIEAIRRYCIRDERTCEQCAGLNGMVARLDSGDLARLLPPSHPNCRCVVSPVVDMKQLIEAGRRLRSDVKSGWAMEGIAGGV